MAITRYGTSVTLCEDTRQTFELFDLLKQADPNYSAVEPTRITLYVFDGATWVTVSAPGFFSAVDKDTFAVDMSYLPNFNGIQQVRVLGSDSSGNSFILNLTINVTPVNDAPTGEDETVALANGDSYVLGLADFGFNDPVEGDAFKSVVFTTVPAHGALLLNGVAVTAGQEILASDIEAGKLSYTAPVDAGGPIGFDFQVRDTGGTDGCGGNDLDLTPNTITFNVPYPATAIIGDRVWEDTNGNGVQDAGETGLAGVTVLLKDIGGNTVATTATDANGNYSFTVNAGTYSVAVVAPAGYKVTEADMGPSDATDSDIDDAGNSPLVTVAAGDNNTTIDAGLFRTAEIGDRVWLDTNGNGQQDTGEAGVAGVIVRLYNAAGDLVDGPLATDANGNYLFTNLRPGTYSVQFDKTTLPAGYSFTTANSGSDVTDSDANSLDGKTIQTVLDSGESDRTWDAGIVANPGAITGTVLEDLDHNGTGDTPIAGVTVVLKDASGAPIATTTTDANGNYSFAGVPAGNYTVEQTNKPGFTDVGDKDGGNPNSIAVTVTPGATNPGNNFIDERTAAIGDKVWLDKNANGVQDAGEAGIAGVTVKLLDSAGNVVTTATTDANGNYLFGNLVPGNYAVQVVAPAGYTVTGKDLGGNDALDSDIDPTTGKTITTTLSAGETDLSWDAGLYQKASIGDRVWLDANKNGVQDTGEAGIAGVTVKLLNAAGGVAATATTDANGNYLFSNLTPGSYSVQVVAPAGYSITGKDLGGNDALDSDIDPATGSTIATTLESGENDLSWDAGLYQQTASYGDKVWLDKNANGVQDAGETGLAGITVKLLNGAGGVVATTTTDANGNYLFSNLTPGDYAAQVVAPTGYFVSPKDQGGNDATDSDFDPTTGKTINTTLVANENDLSWDAGLYQKASIGDKVWADCNNNGLQDGTEAGVPGVVVKLLDASGNVVATTLTDGSGNYVFKDLMPGTYSVQVVAPAGYTFTSQNQGTNDAIDSDVGAGGVSGTNLIVNGSFESGTTGWTGYGDSIEVGTAGAYGVSAVTGAMVAELDANCAGSNTGFYQNVATVAGQTYQLTVDLAQRAGYAASTNTVEVWWEGAKIATIDPASTALTKYSFTVTAVDASSRVEFREQAGDDDSVGGIIDNVSLVSTASSSAGKTAQTVLESGENDLSWDAGLTVQKVTATFDFSGNTATDGTDGNIYGYSNNGISVNASAWSRDKTYGTWSKAFLGAYGGGLGVTDSSEGSGSGDSHTVDNVGRDNYVLFEFSQTVVVDKTYLGYVVGDSDVKVWIGTVNGAFDSHIALTDAVLSSMGFTEVNSTTLTTARWADLNANGFAGNVLVIAANTTGGDCNDNFKIDQLVVSTASAFCATDVSIGDKVWNDANMNGVQDAGEAGIAGVAVKLLNSAGAVITTTTTDANGNYLFSQLAAGDYKIQVVTPNGYVITGKDLGGNDALDSDIDSSGTTGVYTLTQGSNNLSVDAGLYCPPVTASIGDKVWEDMNYNGLQDAGEAGIKGVTVKLLNSAGTVVATATTDANGNYLFSNVAPGDYKVQVVTPTGYYITKQNQGTNDAVDSDIDATGKTALVTLSAGENERSVDAGLYRKASIGDKVWEDVNHNNLLDAGEAGICNVKVWLWSATTQSWTSTFTDANGNYKFTNLDPGSYQICFDKSATIYKGIDMSNWYWAAKDVGTDDSRDADAYSTTDQAYTAFTTLVSGEADMTWDAAITPIVLDLDHNGIQTIAREDSTGKFDLFGNGKAIDSGWISSGDAFLAIDIDHNGKIDNLSELFGGTSKGDGFAKLGAFDSNGDGFVDASDAHFADLRVWQDINGNHQTDAGELRTLAEAGVASLKVDHVDLPAVDAQGNLHLERSSAVMADGSSIDMADVYFNVSLADANEAGVELPNLASLLGDDRSLDLVLGASVSVGEAAVTTASSVGNDSAVAALGQLSSLYEEQQYALMAA